MKVSPDVRPGPAGPSGMQGFTFLEVLMVLFLVCLLCALAFPSFSLRGTDSAMSEARKIASLLRYLHDSALSTKEQFSLTVDFSSSEFRYTGPEGERNERIASLSGVTLQSRGKMAEGELTVFFSPSGTNENLVVSLRDDTEEIEVSFNAMSGRVKTTKIPT